MTSPKPVGNLRRSLALAGVVVLFVLVAAADRCYELHRNPSNRYRFHAIPVALSVLYHGRAHDYTGFKDIAVRFHDRNLSIDHLMKHYADPAAAVGTETYFWSADDRGLADYVVAAFRLFGPKLTALSSFYLVVLGTTVGLFLVGYRRRPALWAVPVFVLLGHLFLLHASQLRGQVQLVDGTFWLEAVALYESRVFELLAAVAWFHLALLAVWRTPPGRAAWLTAVPQAAIMLFLFHARSTIGWEYLALLCVAGGVVLWRGVGRAIGRPAVPGSAGRAAVVALAAVGSLAALGAYKRAVYHPAYFADRGARTFWHNALIGFTYHPLLKERHKLAIDDEPVLHWVIREGRERDDPRWHPDWSTKTFTRSALGGETTFDWTAYEGVARDLYFRMWRENTADVLACYAVYKPWDAAGQVGQVVRLTATEPRPGKWGFFAGGLAAAALALGAVALGRRVGSEVMAVGGLSAAFLAFSVIPCVAFYASISTMSGVYLGLTALTAWFALILVRGVHSLCASTAAPTAETPPPSQIARAA